MPPPGCEPFLRAICAAPDDDTPRLVYADWLQEHGLHERAEFIRLQCEVARARATGWPNKLAERRAAGLWYMYADVWRRSETRQLPGVNWTAFGYYRGFPYQAEFRSGRPGPTGVDTAGLNQAFESAPIRSLFVSGWVVMGIPIGAVGLLPGARHVRELVICPDPHWTGRWSAGLNAALNAPYFGGVRAITVRSGRRALLLDDDDERAVHEAAARRTDWTLFLDGRVGVLQAGRISAAMGSRFTHPPHDP